MSAAPSKMDWVFNGLVWFASLPVAHVDLKRVVCHVTEARSRASGGRVSIKVGCV